MLRKEAICPHVRTLVRGHGCVLGLSGLLLEEAAEGIERLSRFLLLLGSSRSLLSCRLCKEGEEVGTGGGCCLDIICLWLRECSLRYRLSGLYGLCWEEEGWLCWLCLLLGLRRSLVLGLRERKCWLWCC